MIPWYFNLAPYILGRYLFKNNSRVNIVDKNDDEVNYNQNYDTVADGVDDDYHDRNYNNDDNVDVTDNDESVIAITTTIKL